ncbi:protein PLASTID MOVEMENT IMPAIRED 2-like [Hibiscus syriacus]|uniref:protein PLASTID MOVEMENT IMPAIRED 2-like n=1 Tax=Hibiscus syriacus TaxID=106335 RepID=UPI0019217A4B|nr:protein PLASTID MOVEMENT IMPAIRED 2-like [Hibiscus syriacus]
MDWEKYEDERRIGSVTAAVNVYGEMIHAGKFFIEKNQGGFSRELHMERISMNRYIESRNTVESKAVAQFELSVSRETIKDNASMVNESDFKAKSRVGDVESSRKNGYLENKVMVVKDRSIENYQYEEVMRELELVKQELSELKLDMASVMEEKARAKKEFEDSSSRMRSNGASVEAFREQIEAANE